MVARAITVVQMLPDLNEGGVEQGTLEIGRALCRAGHRSVVISRGGRLVTQLEAEGSTHMGMPYIGEKTPRSLLHIPKLRRLLVASNVDILHLRSRLPAWVAYMAWKSLPKARRPRLVTTFHGFYSINGYSAIMTKGERVIAVSQVIADHIRNAYQIPRPRITVIHRGIDPARLAPGAVSDRRVEQQKIKWGVLDGDLPILLIPARITRLKGHDLLVRALSQMVEKQWVLICAGDYDPGSGYFEELRQLCNTLNLSSRVKFVGHCDDMPAAIRAASLVISASTKPESFGRTLIEAQALERAVVAPAHGGSVEIVLPGESGWLFTPGDVQSLEEALGEALENPDRCTQFGETGRRRVLDHFTLSRMCGSTLDLYTELLSK